MDTLLHAVNTWGKIPSNRKRDSIYDLLTANFDKYL